MNGNYSIDDTAESLLYSVIIPVYEHWGLVRRLLQCMGRQSLDSERFEVLLVDNGSENFNPPTDVPSWVRVLKCNKPGSYSARNVGASQAKGCWLVFTDADCQPTKEWLAEIDAKVRCCGGKDVILAGQVEVFSSSHKPTAYEMYDLVKGIPQRRYVSNGYAVTANLVTHMSLWESLGGFEESVFSGGDADFCQRAVRSGVKLIFLETAVVRHPARSSRREVVGKARRIKGGQLNSTVPIKRVVSAIRAFAPPLIAMRRILLARRHPLKFRIVALSIQLQLWAVEVSEVLRWLAGRDAERR